MTATLAASLDFVVASFASAGICIPAGAAVLPPGVEQSLDPDLWPASTIRSTSTITCSYTIKAEE